MNRAKQFTILGLGIVLFLNCQQPSQPEKYGSLILNFSFDPPSTTSSNGKSANRATDEPMTSMHCLITQQDTFRYDILYPNATNTFSVSYVLEAGDYNLLAEGFVGNSKACSLSAPFSITVGLNTVLTHTWQQLPAFLFGPTNLQVTRNPGYATRIDLTWQDHTTQETGYRILRRVGLAGSFSEIASVDTGSGTREFQDSGLEDYMAYYYRVFAYNSLGSSDTSNVDSATTLAFVQWDTVYDIAGYANDVETTPDGGYIVAGGRMLIKTDAYGNEDWRYELPLGYGYAGSVQLAGNNGYVMASSVSNGFGWDAHVVEVSATGAPGWSYTSGDSLDDFAFDIQMTPEGGSIVVGNQTLLGYASNVRMMRFNAAGGLLWSKSLNYSYVDGGMSVQPTAGGFILTGYTSYSDTSNYDVLHMKTDLSGSPLWSKTFGGPYTDWGAEIRQIGGRYIIAGVTNYGTSSNGDLYVVRTDLNGIGEGTAYGESDDYEAGSGLCANDDDSYVVVGSKVTIGQQSIWLIKFSAEDDTLWTHTIGGPGSQTGYSIQTTPDGGYIIAGSSNSSGSEQFYLAKTMPNP